MICVNCWILWRPNLRMIIIYTHHFQNSN
nr:unnamed protein product [Callosobruchus chinensis]